MRRPVLLVGSSAFATMLSVAATLNAGDHCRKAAPDRGLAILSPLESPDPCDSPVGGRYLHTPYYPGYMPDRRCPLPVYGYTGIRFAEPGWRPAGALGGYGRYSGARQDEANLLRLGGLGAGGNGVHRRYRGGGGDVIDLIERNR